MELITNQAVTAGNRNLYLYLYLYLYLFLILSSPITSQKQARRGMACWLPY